MAENILPRFRRGKKIHHLDTYECGWVLSGELGEGVRGEAPSQGF